MLQKDKYLPIGSVVFLKGGIKKAMIVGIMHTSKINEDYVEHDYIAVLYPEGFITTQTMFMFNHDQITDVIYRGYDNPERSEFIDRLEKNVNLVAEELQEKFEKLLEEQGKKETVRKSKKLTPDDIF